MSGPGAKLGECPDCGADYQQHGDGARCPWARDARWARCGRPFDRPKQSGQNGQAYFSQKRGTQ